MTKNIIIIILLIIAVAEAGYIIDKRNSPQGSMAMTTHPSVTGAMPPAGPNAKGKGPVIISKGMNLKSTPLFQYAYEISPNVANDAKAAMVGFSMTSEKQADGSMIVTLAPKDSDDQSQQYIVKSGQILYYIEQTPFDDKNDQDKDLNYRDDYGIITDSNGIVQ